ncbi:MAG TPA: ABC transporter ATP-binding protein [Methylomusa anaerophila]|uniref:Putative ABC transporter ATP-binding protein n=1 Tax=Methylomusa anaerophila TaxID=1930071 RepID=A0A348AEE9_9FIRM|nr:ABC transporter ATP-binding protein [Methylomusa anaerophila]BBB89447.1 putative ABC transporter ATP-binding protein [Methylomusa anaerophila]HML89680.1 ABC transporter ATP-binding protein [Methylomusa anaerophila]
MLALLRSLQARELRLMTGAIITFSIIDLAGAAAIFTLLYMVFGVVNGTITHNTIGSYWLGLAVLLFIQAGATTLGDLISHEAGYSLVGRLRESIALRLQQFSLAFYTKEQLGEVSSVVHKDVDTMEMVVAHLWTRMFANILVSIILGSYLFYTHWQLALVMAAGVSLALAVLIAGTRRRQQAHAVNRADNIVMLGYFLEFVKGMPILKSYKKNDLLQRRLNAAVKQFELSSTRLANAVALVLGHYFGWLEISLALVVTGGAYFVLGNELTVVEFILFVVMSKEFLKPFFAAESYYLNYIVVTNSYQRIQRIMTSPVLPDTGSKGFPASSDITFENISFAYDRQNNREALSKINISLPAGSMTALVGPSGSGKTTLTNLLLRFYDPDDGHIRIGGVDIRDIPYDTLLSHITVVMQDTFLFSGAIYENLLMGNQEAIETQVIIAAQQAMIHEEIMALPADYNTVIGEGGAGLSGGQRQRLAIARAILKGAEIIILDEATSNIDPINEHCIQQAISNLARNRTVLVIAHHLRTIKNADQIIVLENGVVVEAGNHTTLLGNGQLYAALWNAQGRDIKNINLENSRRMDLSKQGSTA